MSDQPNNTGRQTRRLLLIGFGGLLLLLAFTGFNALSVLSRIQARNESIRQDYVNRDRILEQLRSDIYLSGTYVRDLLLEPDLTRADIHRNELNATRGRIEAMITVYRQVLRSEERIPFQRFTRELGSYFDSLLPALQWNATQRRLFGYAFMKDSLLPRRMVVVRLTDQISQLNQDQMETGSSRVTALFSTFRRDLIILLVITLIIGLLLAGTSIQGILRLERLSALRFDEVLQARGALQDLSARLIEAQETERRALSRELHDEVGQALSALLLEIGNVVAILSPDENSEARRQLLASRRLVERTVAAVRDMSLLLRPSMLDDLGLIPALEWQAREVSRTHNLRVTVEAPTVPEDLPDEQRTCIYRVVQEALRNITRHARATQVNIQLSQNEKVLRLTIADDGQGFLPEKQKGLGMLGMEERVKRLSGSFRIESQPGRGTILRIDLPGLALTHSAC